MADSHEQIIHGAKPLKATMAVLPAPAIIDISFRNLQVTVSDYATKARKTILHDVSGSAMSGRLLALMGSSGAGKTTLLDVLAGNTTRSSSSGTEVQGTLLINGQSTSRPRVAAEFKRISCYVQQRDVLLCSATVREAITTSALLKLPHATTRAAKEQRVNEVLKELELDGCADTLIGDELLGLKGISGGQKRRVSVGIELIKDPSVIFLDEPTSGLDSEMALSCMETLVRLAHKGRTVLCTIHQPNSDITSLFDDFMLLAMGHVVYSGPWAGAVQHFAHMGYNCPNYRNPTDYFLAVVRDPQAAEAMWTAHTTATHDTTATSPTGLVPTKPHKGWWETCFSPYATHTRSTAGDVGSEATGGGDGSPLPRDQRGPHRPSDGGSSGHALEMEESTGVDVEQAGPGMTWMTSLCGKRGAGSPAWYQVLVLAQRRVRDWLRNPAMLSSELVQYIFIALFIGLMYWDSFVYTTTDGVTNRTACIWFALAVMSFTPSYTSVANWDRERQLLKREVAQGMYSVTASYCARTAVMVPFQAIQCLLFVSIMYFFAGFQVDAGKFFTFYLVLLLFQLVSEGIGLLCALATRVATMGIVLLTLILLLMLSFSGFLVSTIPVYFRWINKISYLTYAFASLTANEFSGLLLTDPLAPTSDPPGQAPLVPGLQAVPPQILNQFSVWGNVGILAAITGGMELIKLIALQLAYRNGMF